MSVDLNRLRNSYERARDVFVADPDLTNVVKFNESCVALCEALRAEAAQLRSIRSSRP